MIAPGVLFVVVMTAFVRRWWRFASQRSGCVEGQPDKAIIDFEGPDEERYWSCVWERGELSDLDYD